MTGAAEHFHVRHLSVGEDDEAAKHAALLACHIFVVGIFASVVYEIHKTTFATRE